MFKKLGSDTSKMRTRIKEKLNFCIAHAPITVKKKKKNWPQDKSTMSGEKNPYR